MTSKFATQKPGPRPRARAFRNHEPGQKPLRPTLWARLGPAFFGLAWPGFWLQAGAGTSLVGGHKNQSPNHSENGYENLWGPQKPKEYTPKPRKRTYHGVIHRETGALLYN